MSLTTAQAREAVARRSRGEAWGKIAKRFGVGPQVVHRAVAALDGIGDVPNGMGLEPFAGIARELGISTEAAAEIERGALTKLRRMLEAKGFGFDDLLGGRP